MSGEAVELPVITFGPDGSYSPDLGRVSVDGLGEDGAWLATSILHYGWRAHYDLARCLADQTSWEDEQDPIGPRHVEYQIVRDLQVQAHLYSAAEQLATLVDSIYAHGDGGDFFETYVGRRDLWQRIEAVGQISRDRLGELLGAPTSREALRDDLKDRGMETPGTGVVDLDPRTMPTAQVGGLLVPRTVIDQAVSDHMWERVAEMIDGIHRNLAELAALVERPQSSPIRSQSLREVDNSFRHGLRVLFHRAVPSERTFQVLGTRGDAGEHWVDLYLPRTNEEVRFASMDCSPTRTATHLETIRMLCLRTGQVVNGFVAALWGNSSILARSVNLTLGDRTDAEAPPPDPPEGSDADG
jgi:hypothetical protein